MILMESLLKQLLDEMKALRSDVDQIKNTMATKEDVADLPLIKRAVLETADVVKEIHLIQNRQQSVIELLSSRSIEHEAELKRRQQRPRPPATDRNVQEVDAKGTE
jgi:hypothetical protein